MAMVLSQYFLSLTIRRKRRIAVTVLIFVAGAFSGGSLFPDVTLAANNIVNTSGANNINNGLNNRNRVNIKNHTSGSFCNNEGSLHQLALDMINYSSPPGSKSYQKLKHVLDLRPLFYLDMGAQIFSTNKLMMRRMFHGIGLREQKFKPSLLDNVTLVETFYTKSPCPILEEGCINLPRILIQTEQATKWAPFVECHKSPNCIILEFSDYNMKKTPTDDMSDSYVLLPVMTQTPSRLSMGEPKIPKIIQHRSIDMVFFGTITNRRTFLTKAADAYREAHPDRTVHIDHNNQPVILAAAYAEAKVCLILHSYRSISGGEYHRLSEFAPFGCIPVMEKFADTIGIRVYERCGGAVFTNHTNMMAAAEDVIAKIDRGSYNLGSKAITNWWRAGINWEKILPAVFGVEEVSLF